MTDYIDCIWSLIKVWILTLRQICTCGTFIPRSESGDIEQGFRDLDREQNVEDNLRLSATPQPPRKTVLNADGIGLRPSKDIITNRRQEAQNGNIVGSSSADFVPEAPEVEQYRPETLVYDRDWDGQIVVKPSLFDEDLSVGVPKQQFPSPPTDDRDQSRVIRRPLEAVDRFFFDRGDLCSESEIIKDCKALNGRVETLVFALQDEWETQAKGGGSGHVRDQTEKTMGDFDNDLKDALGECLLDMLKRIQPGDDEHHGCIQDAFQAWTVYVIHRSIRSTLFGIDARSIDDLNEIYSQMRSQEPELAIRWSTVLRDSSPRSFSIQTADEQGRFAIPGRKDEVNELLDNAFTSIRTENGTKQEGGVPVIGTSTHAIAVALHWRALIHSYERNLASWSRAMDRTQRYLIDGLCSLYAYGCPGQQDPAHIRDKVKEIVEKTKLIEEAAKLEEKMICGFFSVYLEPDLPRPGSIFDSHVMDCSDTSQTPSEDTNEKKVLAATDLGVRDSTKPEIRMLLKPKVLLVYG